MQIMIQQQLQNSTWISQILLKRMTKITSKKEYPNIFIQFPRGNFFLIHATSCRGSNVFDLCVCINLSVHSVSRLYVCKVADIEIQFGIQVYNENTCIYIKFVLGMIEQFMSCTHVNRRWKGGWGWT